MIVDEFHHAAATSYAKVLDHLEPAELIGLTATPERSDGLPILQWFDDRIAAELRLWDAIDQQYLAPFLYYGIHDGLDLSDIPWRRGRGYDTQALFLGNVVEMHEPGGFTYEGGAHLDRRRGDLAVDPARRASELLDHTEAIPISPGRPIQRHATCARAHEPIPNTSLSLHRMSFRCEPSGRSVERHGGGSTQQRRNENAKRQRAPVPNR